MTPINARTPSQPIEPNVEYDSSKEVSSKYNDTTQDSSVTVKNVK